MTTRILFLLALLPAPASAALPQGPDLDAAGKIGAPLPLSRLAETPTVHFDEPGDGAIWARGRTYKARFGADGFTYVPFFGSAAPRNFPIALSLASARIGTFELASGGAVAPVRVGDQVFYDRGLLLERYDLTPDGLEQVFVVRERVGGGDLAVRMAIETDLLVAEDAEGIHFAVEGLGGVRYSRAVAFGSDGLEAEVATRHDGGGIELRVPGASAAGTTFPLTIDPVFSTFTVNSATTDDFLADVAKWSGVGSQLVVCFERVFSATDHDVYAMFVNASGPETGTGAYVDVTTADWRSPSVAGGGAGGLDNFLFAASRTAVGGLFPNVWGRLRDANTPGVSMGAQFQIGFGFGTGELNPDVGGDRFGDYCVVWNDGVGSVRARLVASSGSLLGPGSLLLGTGQYPSISKVNGSFIAGATGAPDRWTVVWERTVSPSPLNRNIYGAQIHENGTVVTPAFPIATSSQVDESAPTVSSMLTDSSGNYLVAYESQSFFATQSDIYGRILSGSTLVAGPTNLTVLEGVAASREQIHPSADSDGCRFAVAYAEQYMTSATDYDIYVATFHQAGSSIGLTEGHVNLAYSGSREDRPRLATTGHYSYLVAWDDAVSSTNHNVEGAIYRGHTASGGNTSLPTGCGGLTLTLTDPQPALGSALQYDLDPPPFLVGALILFGLPATPLTLCAAGCQLGVSPILLVEPGNELNLWIPCDPFFLGASVAAQGVWYGAVSGTSCPGSINFRTSNTIVSTIQ